MERNAESSQHLLTLAHEHGYNVSMHQLVRWHRAGLLPRPKQLMLGKAQGSQSLYPHGTSEQFLLLCTLRTRERRLSHLAWQLWWAGYPVALSVIRKHIEHAATQLSQLVQFFVALKASEQIDDEEQEGRETARVSPTFSRDDICRGDPCGLPALIDFTEQLALARLDYKPLRHARKRVGKTYFPTFIRLLLDVISGTFEGYDEAYDDVEVMTELRILAKGMGLHELFIKDDTNLDHFIRKRFVPFMQNVGLWIKTLPWEKAVRVATDFELMQTRDDIRNAMLRTEHPFPRPNYLLRTYPTQSIALREILQTTTVDEQAMLLALWLAVRMSTSSYTSLMQQ